MKWGWLIAGVPMLLGLIGFLIYWYWRYGKISALATVARVDLKTGPDGVKEYSTRVRLFDKDVIASDEWWPLGAFASTTEAASAIRKFHGERVTNESWCAFFDEFGKASVVHLGTLAAGGPRDNSL